MRFVKTFAGLILISNFSGLSHLYCCITFSVRAKVSCMVLWSTMQLIAYPAQVVTATAPSTAHSNCLQCWIILSKILCYVLIFLNVLVLYIIHFCGL